jgi:uncharacterized protein
MTFDFVAVRGIQVYQASLGEWLPDRCRFSPTCSQYAIEACKRFGARRGLKLAIARIRRCHRPNGGRDPVPVNFPQELQDLSIWKTKVARNEQNNKLPSQQSNLRDVENRLHYNTEFKLMLGSPFTWRTLNLQSFSNKAEQYKQYMFSEQYALCFVIDTLEAGVASKGKDYVFKVAGTVDKELLEPRQEEFEKLILTQFETFFGIESERFRVIYASYDGIVVKEPDLNEPIVPPNYDRESDFWDSSAGDDFWLVRWTVDLSVNLAADIVGDIVGEGIAAGVEGCSGSFFESTPEVEGCGDGLMDGCFDGGVGCEGVDFGLGGCDGCSFS